MVTATEQGRRLAAVLSGGWRPAPPPVTIDPDGWDATAARLLETGAGAISWWRVRVSNLQHAPASSGLLKAYRLCSLGALRNEILVAQVLTLCSAAGLDPILAKGWATARLYPEPGLRPCGDVDLFVRPGECAAAKDALASFTDRPLSIDLHAGFPDLSDRRFDDVFDRSNVVSVGGVCARVPGPEDQLRHLSVHFMRHGAWRPIWLVDIAAALESVDGDFDWDYCLSGSRQRTRAVACAAGLAHVLLGARLDHATLRGAADRLPRWLVPAVLRQWGVRYERYADRPFAMTLRRPADMVAALRRRWPNQIETTMSVGGPFNNLPRLPLQIADCVSRTAVFAARLPGRWAGARCVSNRGALQFQGDVPSRHP
jgi:hypothetical protein